MRGERSVGDGNDAFIVLFSCDDELSLLLLMVVLMMVMMDSGWGWYSDGGGTDWCGSPAIGDVATMIITVEVYCVSVNEWMNELDNNGSNNEVIIINSDNDSAWRGSIMMVATG